MNHVAENTYHGGGARSFAIVWLWLLAITAIEVVLACEHLRITVMLILLMGLSVVKAYLIISYFMHLRYEKLSLAATLIPPLVLVISLLFLAFPDSLRILELGPK